MTEGGYAGTGKGAVTELHRPLQVLPSPVWGLSRFSTYYGVLIFLSLAFSFSFFFCFPFPPHLSLFSLSSLFSFLLVSLCEYFIIIIIIINLLF